MNNSMDSVTAVRPCRFSMSVQPTLHLLFHEIAILSVNKSQLSSVTHSLLKITLKLLEQDPSYRRVSFFSFTETNDEYSLLLDKKLYQELKEECGPSFDQVSIADGTWRPIVIEVGAFSSMTGISKIAANVITPLADAGVSVFCLSSNQEDYVMVNESDLETAVNCLCKDNQFRIICDSDRPNDVQLVESVIASSKLHCHNNNKHSSNISRLITHPFNCSDIQYRICSVMSSMLSTIVHPLLQLMFFSSKQREFFSFSIIDDNISLVIDSRDITKFPNESVYAINTQWRIFTIGNSPLGFDECGIVAQMSSPLAHQEISTFYICTFNTDHILICESNVENALEVLTQFTTSSTKSSNNNY